MPTVYRNKVNGRLYWMFRVTPRAILGEWIEVVDLRTGQVRKLLPFSRVWNRKNFEPVWEE